MFKDKYTQLFLEYREIALKDDNVADVIWCGEIDKDRKSDIDLLLVLFDWDKKIKDLKILNPEIQRILSINHLSEPYFLF